MPDIPRSLHPPKKSIRSPIATSKFISEGQRHIWGLEQHNLWIDSSACIFEPISGVTILLSLTVFSQVLADTMPATSDAIPLLGNFKANRHPPTQYITNFMYAKQPYINVDKLFHYI